MRRAWTPHLRCPAYRRLCFYSSVGLRASLVAPTRLSARAAAPILEMSKTDRTRVQVQRNPVANDNRIAHARCSLVGRSPPKTHGIATRARIPAEETTSFTNTAVWGNDAPTRAPRWKRCTPHLLWSVPRAGLGSCPAQPNLADTGLSSRHSPANFLMPAEPSRVPNDTEGIVPPSAD